MTPDQRAVYAKKIASLRQTLGLLTDVNEDVNYWYNAELREETYIRIINKLDSLVDMYLVGLWKSGDGLR